MRGQSLQEDFVHLDSFLEHSKVFAEKKRQQHILTQIIEQARVFFCKTIFDVAFVKGSNTCVTLTPPAPASFLCIPPWSWWLHLLPVCASSLLGSQSQALGALEGSMNDKAGHKLI